MMGLPQMRKLGLLVGFMAGELLARGKKNFVSERGKLAPTKRNTAGTNLLDKKGSKKQGHMPELALNPTEPLEDENGELGSEAVR